MADDLFSDAAAQRLAHTAPLAARLRPRSIDEVVGQEHLTRPGAALRTLIESDRLSSIVLWGPPGTGKTTLARLVASSSQRAFEQLSATSASVKDLREVISRAEERLGMQGKRTILFLDEVHRFNRAQQDALLPAVESGLLTFIGATTENPFFEINPPLLSRSTLFRLEPLDPAAIRSVLERGLALEAASAAPEALEHIAGNAAGDGRQALGYLEIALALAGEARHVLLAHAEEAVSGKALRYGRDAHYDVASAFIKSIRGSDPDAGLYWLAVMIEAGEDPRFVARRLVILASEDIGMADSSSLQVAEAAAGALELVGLPEAQLNLAHAVVHLATAPKSNRVTVALARARRDAQAPGAHQVPAHLRDSSYRGAGSLGHGEGYDYPHDDPSGWVRQAHRPEGIEGNVYYEPSPHGEEREVAERMAARGHRETPHQEGRGSL